MGHVLIEGSFYPYRYPSVHSAWRERPLSTAPWTLNGMNAAQGRIQNHHLLRLHPLCIAQVIPPTTAIKADHHLVVRLHPQTTGAVDPLGTVRHRKGEEEGGVIQNVLQCVPTGDLAPAIERKNARGIETDRGNIQEGTGHDPDHGEGLVPETEDAVVVETEVEIDTAMSQPVVAPQPNAFKNDGSFMEMFKKMQEQMQPEQKPTTSTLEEKPVIPPPLMVGKRRGGRILKTGMVAKPKTEQTVEQPKDAWSLYMAEVKKYREVCCQEEDNTRPLVK
ncbi:hypothetical protein KM043_015716 [Ampulex compressa]|nr:hypothetical protein KM043_015716 [Ampulex compressa]